ncbi:NAD-dependent succinate-semialdehyde dehydrogenase [Mesorhizobium sp. BAC0120]|uniref:NAD-dependent succinate-semialdehyde dehydrogenase n=1 Tax=Mesorhizobium sp. BAC0120 TaxID=3090670 RepID=UPI00298D4548|nr:NAD-dependent succinate-semialdehyde dehydrogenase [Mesorhizobium sp. BAC0120]MDW6020159.1 NAD-dependent succinate-semialdehyde dehydrogenase [Mesorhizobium sp. BAC0120]
MTMNVDLPARLKDPTLLREAAYIDGEWLDSTASRGSFAVTNPSTGDTIATLPDLGASETARAIEAAFAAQKPWAALAARERSILLRRWHDLIIANADDLAAILTGEMGKPFAEARGEVLYGAAYIEWFAEEAKRIYGDVIPGHQRDKRIVVLKQPVGVVGTITPWNFPNAMIARKLAPALAVGCTVVSKPAEQTPLSAIALAVLAERAGIPAGVVNIIVGTDGPAIGKELCGNDKVRKISFTGSTEVGRILMRQSADQIKKLSLELGGNAPFIVFDDADIDAAVEGAMISKFRNAGQTCVCANRIYVQSTVYDAFAEKLTRRVASLKVGDGFLDGVTTGPLIDEAAMAKVHDHLSDAVAKGATIVAGGKPHELGGTFFQPTVLTNVEADMKVAREETFGPVAPLFRFDTVEDVIRQANDTEFGLAAYFYARDTSKIWMAAEALEYGMVGINTGLISTEVAPFGGVKQSGLGREGSKYGAEDYLEMKYLCLST